MRLWRAFGVLGLIMLAWGAGCATSSGEVEVAHPMRAGLSSPRVVEVAHVWGDEVALRLPQGALTSHAQLVRADDEQVCVDALLRLWSGASREGWRMTLRGDDAVWLSRQGLDAFACDDPRAPDICDHQAQQTDALPQVRTHAMRLCTTSHTLSARTSRVELVAHKPGVTMRFVWALR